MYEERWYMTKLKTAEGRSFQTSIANREEHMLTLRVAAMGILPIRRSVRDFCNTKGSGKGHIWNSDGFFLKTKGSLPKIYKVFWE